MSFPQSDARASLSAPGGAGLLRAADSAEIAVLASDAGLPHEWYVRGQNFLVNHVRLLPGEALSRAGQADEYMVLLPDAATRVLVETVGGRREVAGNSLLILPPGDSTVTALTGGRLLRLFSAQASDLLPLCVNNASYSAEKVNVAPYAPWPSPPDGFRLRVYSMDVPDVPGRFGRIWRCSTLMINYLPVQHGPRNPRALSPHQHEDFEQGSVGLDGDFVHHLRWPWTVNRLQWRDDQHVHCPSPSVAVIPPPALHTTEATGQADNQLVDVFCPPRDDFSREPGWVLNEADYPYR